MKTICPGSLVDVDGYVGVVLGGKQGKESGRRWGVLVARGEALETIELDIEDVEGLLPWTGDTGELKRAADRCRLSGLGMIHFMHESLGGAR